MAADVRSANRSSCLPLRGDLRWSPLGARQVFDPILDLAAGAVDVLVEGAGVDRGGAERGHDETGIGALGQVLGLGDDAPLAAPAVQRAPLQLGEAARRAALSQAIGFRRGELCGDRADQALVAREAEDVVDAVRLAPRHQFVPGKARSQRAARS